PDRQWTGTTRAGVGGVRPGVSYDGRVATTDHRASLRRVLDPDPRPALPPGDRSAAVLALVIETPEPALLFTERSAELHRHPGEVSFPGGLRDPDDADLLAPALREIGSAHA